MTTQLTLDAPGAAEALGRAYALLRRWAREALEQETAVSDDPGRESTPTAAHTAAPSQGQSAVGSIPER